MISRPQLIFLLHPEMFNLFSCIDAFHSAVYYVQPSYISAHDNSFCIHIKESVYIPSMIVCISNKHTFFSSIVQRGSHLFTFMFGKHCHFSKGSHEFHVFCIFPIE